MCGAHKGSCTSGHPYLILLPVGFALPRLLPAARCALTAPFHPSLLPKRKEVCFLWHCPWGCPRRPLAATASSRSPDFPPPVELPLKEPLGCAQAITFRQRPSGRLVDADKERRTRKVKTKLLTLLSKFNRYAAVRPAVAASLARSIKMTSWRCQMNLSDSTLFLPPAPAKRLAISLTSGAFAL